MSSKIRRKPLTFKGYSIEIRDANGVSLVSATALWTEKERRMAFAQIERLAALPEVSFNVEAALTPQSARNKPRRLRGQSLVRTRNSG